MAYWLSDFAGVTIPTNLGMSGSMDVAGGVADAPLVSLPGGRVLDPLGTNPAYRPSAQLTVRCLIVSDTPATIKTTYDNWQAKIGVRGTLTRTADSGGSTQTVTARLLSASVNRQLMGSRSCPLTLVFQVSGFPWLGADVYTTLTKSTVSTTVYSNTVTNAGNATQRALFISVLAAAGSTMTSYTITNTTTGHSLVYTGTLLPAKSLVIDTGALTVKNDGVADYAHLTPSTSYEDWFQIAAGANTITHAATFAGGTGVDTTLTVTNAYA